MFSIFQVPECNSDHVPPHSTLPDHSRHYQQGRQKATAGPQRPCQGHPTGTRPHMSGLHARLYTLSSSVFIKGTSEQSLISVCFENLLLYDSHE